MKKILGTALAAGAAIVGSAAMAGSANAAVAYNIGIASDYVFRGVDQFANYGNPEAFGGVDWTSEGSHFYVGTWVSNTATAGSGVHNVEIDVYGGWKPVVGPVTFDLGAIGYVYTDTPSAGGVFGDTSKATNFELKAGASVPLGKATLGAKAYWTPNFLGDYDGAILSVNAKDGWYFEGNAAYTFTNKATVSAAVGYVTVDDWAPNSLDGATDSYVTGNIGVSYPIMDHLTIDGRVYQNSADAVNFTSIGTEEDTKVVATLTAAF